MLNPRHASKFAQLTIGAAFFSLCGSPVTAHAPVTLPLRPLHVRPVILTHAQIVHALIRPSTAAVPATHILGAPISGLTAMSHTSRIPFDLSFRDYPEEQHEKLTSIVVLLVHSEKLDKAGDFKRRDEVNAQARQLLFSLGKQTVLKVGRDAQFLQLNVLKHLFQI